MHRLIEKGLMFGNLLRVDGPALVERYNRALEQLTGRRTALEDFHIDLSGFSPEVGDELGDMAYLNHDGCNRQFILLSVQQKRAPLLNMTFSTARPILRAFIEANEAALFALTAQDAVAGELRNSVFDIARPSRLFDLRQITVEADTTRSHVADARALQDRIARFRSDPDAWWDDVLIAEMIGLARRTGDVTRSPVVLDRQVFPHGNFWTSHFGGSYVFHQARQPFVATADPAAFAADPQVTVPAAGLGDRNRLARLLQENALAEPIIQARGADAAAILRQKMDFVLIDAAAEQGLDLAGATRADLRQVARRLGAALPQAFLGLADLLRWVEAGGAWPEIDSRHPSYFYTLRATPGPDRDLANRLLAELTPMDFRQLFICHKELFYRTYAGWAEGRRQLVADFLEREYQVDKAGMRTQLFGPEPGMDEALPPGTTQAAAPVTDSAQTTPTQVAPTQSSTRPQRPAAETDDLVARVGPWGAVRR